MRLLLALPFVLFSVLMTAMADDEESLRAESAFFELIGQWNPPREASETVQWALNQHNRPTDPFFKRIEVLHRESDGFGCYEIALQMRKRQGLNEEQQRRAVHLAVVLAAGFTFGGAGMPNAGLTAIEHFLSRSRFSSIRLLAAKASQNFSDTPGGNDGHLYDEAVDVLRGAYESETDQNIKTEIERALRDCYSTGPLRPQPSLLERIACSLRLMKQAKARNYAKDF